MRVLSFTDYFPPHVGGGVEKVVYEVTKSLAARGDEMAVLTLNTRRSSPSEVLDGVQVMRAGIIDLSGFTGLQMACPKADVLGLALAYCRKLRPDVIHAHNAFFSTSVVAVLVSKLMRIPLVLTLHLADMNGLGEPAASLATAYERSVGRWMCRNSDVVVCVSRAVRRHAEQALKVPPEKIHVVPNGVDLAEFHPRLGERNGGKVRVAVVGRLIRNKGVQDLIRAAPAIVSKNRDVEFVVAGEGPMKETLEAMAAHEHVDGWFKFVGQVPSVGPILRDCDVLVRPSLTDGMPLVVLEGMASGLAVVATRVAGTPEVVTDGETGLLCPPGDPEALAKAVNRVLADPKLVAKLGSNARQFIEKHHSWSTVADMYREIYGSVSRIPS